MGRTVVTKTECLICKQTIEGEMYILEKVKVNGKFEMASLPTEWQFVFHPNCFCHSVEKNTLIKAIVIQGICGT